MMIRRGAFGVSQLLLGAICWIFGATGAALKNHDLLASLEKVKNLIQNRSIGTPWSIFHGLSCLFGFCFSCLLMSFSETTNFQKDIYFQYKNNDVQGLDPSKIMDFGSNISLIYVYKHALGERV